MGGVSPAGWVKQKLDPFSEPGEAEDKRIRPRAVRCQRCGSNEIERD